MTFASNMATVYNTMREQGSSILASAYAGVGTSLARLTGVENVSYAIDGTDPVTGQQYNIGQRIAYTAWGAGQLVATALGVKGAGEVAVQGFKSLLKSSKLEGKSCFTEGTPQVKSINTSFGNIYRLRSIVGEIIV
jgi:hypothetical protein